VILFLAFDYEIEPRLGFRSMMMAFGLLLIFIAADTQSGYYPLESNIYLVRTGTFIDRLSVLCTVIYLGVWFYKRRTNSQKQLLLMRSSALFVAMIAVSISGNPHWVAAKIALIPLLDTILFELMHTPKMVPSLYRGSPLRTMAAVVINPGWPGAVCFGQISLVVLYLSSAAFTGMIEGSLVYYLALVFGFFISPIALSIARGKVVSFEQYLVGNYFVLISLMLISRWAEGRVDLESSAIVVSLLSFPVVNYGLYRHMQLLRVKRDYYCAGPESEFPWGR
jgi:hypothetical protein